MHVSPKERKSMIFEIHNQHKLWRQHHFHSEPPMKIKKRAVQNKTEKIQNKSAWMTASQGGFISLENNISKEPSFSGVSPKGFKKIAQDWHNFTSRLAQPISDAFEKFGQKEKVKKFFNIKPEGKVCKMLEKMGESQAILESLIVFGLSVGLKPILTMSLGNVKEEDKKYSVSKTVIGAIVDIALAMVSTLPLKSALGKLSKKIDLLQGKSALLKDPQQFKMFKKIVEYIPKYGLIPLRAFLTILFLDPTLKILFPDHPKTKAKEAKSQEQIKNENANVLNVPDYILQNEAQILTFSKASFAKRNYKEEYVK